MIGHNAAPAHAEKRADILQRLQKFLEGADIWAARDALDAETAPRARDFLAGAKKLQREADDARKEEKQPHSDAAKAVDDYWWGVIERIGAVADVVAPKLEAFLREEKKRAAEAKAEAERQRAELEAQARARAADAAMAQSESARIQAEADAKEMTRQAAAAETAARKAAGPVRVGSATGLANRVGLRTRRTARITSVPLAFAHFRAHPDIEALLVRLANAEMRAAPTLDGVKQLPAIPGVEWVEEEGLAA